MVTDINKIKINGKFLFQDHTGVQRFALEICRALIKNYGISLEIYVPNKNFKDPFDGEAKYISPPLATYSLFIFENIYLPFIAGERLISLSGVGPIFAAKQSVVLHDAAVWDIPDSYSKLFVLKHRIIQIIYRITKVKFLTVSEFSRNNISKILGIPVDQIKVINNGWEHVKSENLIPYDDFIMEKQKFKKNFVIVGSIAKHKGVTKIISMIQSCVTLHDVGFHIVGNRSHIFKAQKIIKTKNIKFYSNMSDMNLFYMIKNSDGLISPSLYEGFGIPPLEALAFNTNIILNNIPVYDEIYGRVAHFFDIRCVESLVTALHSAELNCDDAEVKKLLDNYSWRNAARSLLEAIV